MKKMFRAVYILLIAFILFGCDTQKKNQKESSITSIEVVSNNLQFDENFKLSDVQVNVSWDDGTNEQIPLSENMISIDDLSKFQQEGNHTIHVTYLNASTSFEITITGEKGDPGVDGSEVELQVSDGYIQWKYTEDTAWTNLVNLSDYEGTDGKEVVFQVSNGFIQWQYDDETAWMNLIDLTILTGAQGEAGTNGKEVVFQVANGYIQWQYDGETTWTNLIELTTLTGAQGEAGTNGKEVVFQVADGYIQWQYIGDTTWTNLVELSTLVGPKGEDGVDGREVTFQVTDGHIQWKYIEDTKWINLIALSSLTGIEGLSAYEIYLQYYPSYIGDEVDWIKDLIDGSLIDRDSVSVEFNPQEGILPDGYSNIITTETGNTINLPIPTREGFTFLGWYTGLTANHSQFTNTTDVPGSLMLYAKWEVKTYIVKYLDYNNCIISFQIVEHGQSAIAPKIEDEMIGYTPNWDISYDSVISDITVKVIFIPNEYQIVFNTIEGSPVNPLTVTFDSQLETLPVPTKEGYTFEGWMLDSEIFHLPYQYIITDDITLTAKWQLDEFDYIIADNEVTITGYKGSNTDVIIPSTIEGYSVSIIGEEAFAQSTLTSITIPSSIREVSENILLPNSLENIIVDENNPYYSSINGVLYNKDATKLIRYPEGKTDTSFIVPNSVTTIVDYAACNNSLTSVTIPESVINIGISAFNYYKLASFSISESNPAYKVDNEFLLTKDNLTLIALIGEHNGVTLPNSVTTIGDYAFYNNSLTSVTIPVSLTTIGYRAFSGNSLTSVTVEGVRIRFNDTWTDIGFPIELKPLEDTIQPVFSSIPTDQSIEHGTTLDLLSLGITAYDDVYGDLTNSITVDIKNTSTLSVGSYTVTYSVSDLEGNEAVITISLIVTTNAYYFVLNYSGDTIVSYSISGGSDVVIPAYINGKLITTIENSAFSFNNKLTSVTIPDSVINIGVNVFNYYKITNFSISENNPAYKVENEFLLTKDNLTLIALIGEHNSVTIPNSVTTIGDYAFYNNSLTNVTIPDSVTTIGSWAFYKNSLTSVTIPDSVTTIGSWAFSSNELISVTIPNSVTTIGIRAFSGNSLTSVKIPVGLTTISNATFSYNSLTSVIIPNGVTTIGDHAFFNNSLTSVSIPDSVTTIGESAFNGNSLTSITIPNSVKTIGINAFYSNSLTSITIPNSVTIIGNNAFSWNSLTSVTIPNSVTIIGNNAFSWNSLTSVTILDSVTTIGDYAFYNNLLTSVTIPDSVTTIGANAFLGNLLTSVTVEGIRTRFNDTWYSTGFPGELKPVEDTTPPVFSNKPADQTIEYGTALDLLSLGLTANDVVYGDLTDIISVDIKNTSILPVGTYTVTYSVSDLEGNESVVTISLLITTNAHYFTLNSDGDTIVDYDISGGNDVVIPEYINGKLITTIGENAFFYKALTSVTIPESVTTIGEGAFSDNSLTSVTIPYGVTTIGNFAFIGNSLTHITIPECVTTIGEGAFAYNSLTSVTFTNSVTTIGNEAFIYNSITSVTLPDSVISIGIRVFDYYKLTSFNISENNPAYKIENDFLLTKDNLTLIALIGEHDSATIPNSVTTIGDYAFSWSSLTSVTIPDSVTTIGNWAFYYNSLTSVIIPDSVTTIGDRAFSTNGLISVTIPNSVTTIGDYAFYDNSLTSVSIPVGLTTIKDAAFGNNSLTSIIIPNSVTTIEGYAFFNNPLTSVSIPDSVTTIGDFAFYNNLLTSVTIPDSVTTIGKLAFDVNSLTSVTVEGNRSRFNDTWSYIGFPIGLKPLEDTTPPVFSSVPTDQTIEYGTDLDLLSLGLTANDLVYGDLTDSISVDITDTSELTIGSYSVTYSVSDLEGNEGTVTINLIVVDTTS